MSCGAKQEAATLVRVKVTAPSPRRLRPTRRSVTSPSPADGFFHQTAGGKKGRRLQRNGALSIEIIHCNVSLTPRLQFYAALRRRIDYERGAAKQPGKLAALTETPRV